MAAHDLDSPLQVFDATILEDVMSIFITSAALKLIKGVLHFVMSERYLMPIFYKFDILLNIVEYLFLV